MNKHYHQEALVIRSHGDPTCRGLEGLADTTRDRMSDGRTGHGLKVPYHELGSLVSLG